MAKSKALATEAYVVPKDYLSQLWMQVIQEKLATRGWIDTVVWAPWQIDVVRSYGVKIPEEKLNRLGELTPPQIFRIEAKETANGR